MAKIVQETRFELANRELLALDHVEGQVLTCVSGELWITLDGCQEDIILGPGRHWQVPYRAPLVVSALKPSVLLAVHPRGRALCFRPRRRAEWLLAQLLRWRHPPLSSMPATLLR